MTEQATGSRKLVVIGLAGPTLDVGSGPQRWGKWRPTVAVGQQPDLLVDRVELLYQPVSTRLVELLTADLGSVSPQTEVRPHPLAIADPWDFEEVFGVLHQYAGSYPFDTEREDYLVNITTGTHVWQICLFLLTESRHFPARLLQLSPRRRRDQDEPGDAGRYSIIDLDLSRYDRIAARFRRDHDDGASFLKSGIATRNPRFNSLIERIEQVAIRSRAPVLLTGPTGAGKSQLARRVYQLKRARHQIEGRFVEVNCATLRGDAAMSTLFGHVRGAFTGAGRDRPGLLRAADGGVLFLDEIGELGLDEQAMLLRCLEERVFLPVGADVESRSEFQLIAGSNRDLAAEVAGGRFREDLLARINLWTFRLPGLAERTEDIEPNLAYELARYENETGSRVGFTRAAEARYLSFATSARGLWRASFRDLVGSVERMATLAPGGRIGGDVVTEEIGRLEAAWRGPVRHGDDGLADLIGQERLAELDRFERVQLADVVSVCRSSASLSAAGRLLFAASRRRRVSTNDADRLRKYLGRYGIDWAAITSGA